VSGKSLEILNHVKNTTYCQDQLRIVGKPWRPRLPSVWPEGCEAAALSPGTTSCVVCDISQGVSFEVVLSWEGSQIPRRRKCKGFPQLKYQEVGTQDKKFQNMLGNKIP